MSNRQFSKKNVYLKPNLPHWHHDFLDRKISYIQHGDKKERVYRQPYKGIWIIFWQPPTPEDIKLAQDDFDTLYPECEECSKNLFVCTCMLEMEGLSYE